MAIRILIVDDDASMRNTLREIITAHGWELAGVASNGRDGVEKAVSLKPDITLMDIVMPYMNGIEATREILRQDPGAIVIICSLLNFEPMARNAIEAGARDFLVKPFNPHCVKQIVEKVLKK